jgi:hypothetical protein
MPAHRAIALVRWAAELMAKPAVISLPRAEGPPSAPAADMSVLSSAVSVAIIMAEWGNIDCVKQNRLRGSGGPTLAVWADTSRLWLLAVSSLALSAGRIAHSTKHIAYHRVAVARLLATARLEAVPPQPLPCLFRFSFALFFFFGAGLVFCFSSLPSAPVAFFLFFFFSFLDGRRLYIALVFRFGL